MKMIEVNNGKDFVTRTGAYIVYEIFDAPATEDFTPTRIEVRWIDPDEAALILSQNGKYDELAGYFTAWHKLPQALRDEWIKSQREQNPYGGINPGIPEVENILKNA